MPHDREATVKIRARKHACGQRWTGRPPFDGQTALTIILKVLHEEPPLLRAVDPSIPADLETIVGKCMEKNPAQRYETAKALADDLQCYLDGEPIHARRASNIERLARWLLMASDRVSDTIIPLSHDFLSMMLASRRPGVTVALGTLKHAGIIRNTHGRIEILSRDGLEAAGWSSRLD